MGGHPSPFDRLASAHQLLPCGCQLDHTGRGEWRPCPSCAAYFATLTKWSAIAGLVTQS